MSRFDQFDDNEIVVLAGLLEYVRKRCDRVFTPDEFSELEREAIEKALTDLADESETEYQVRKIIHRLQKKNRHE